MPVDSSILILTILTVFVTSVLLLALIFSRLHWFIKAALIVMSLFLGAGSYYAYREARGWPVSMPLPEKFQLISALVNEPSNKQPGSIIVWLVTPSDPEPRAVRLPYSKPMHKLVQQSRAKGEKGQESHLARKSKGPVRPSGNPTQNGPEGEEFEFELPPSTAVPKD